jgi:hypothetical protein
MTNDPQVTQQHNERNFSGKAPYYSTEKLFLILFVHNKQCHPWGIVTDVYS